MTSKNNPLIKTLLVLLMIVIGIGFSVFSMTKQIQASEIKSNRKNNEQKASISTQKSKMEKKLQHELSMLISGNKNFNPRFLNQILASNNKYGRE